MSAENRQLRKDDPITVQPDGRIATILSTTKERGIGYAYVLMKDTQARLKVPLKLCKRAHVKPDIKPSELKREWAFRAINHQGEVVEEGAWHSTKVQAEKERRVAKMLYNRAVRLQIIERAERICDEQLGDFNPGRYF